MFAARAAASQFLVGRIGFGVAQIVRDRVVEEIRFLRDDADVAAQRFQRERAHVVSVDAARALLADRKSAARAA